MVIKEIAVLYSKEPRSLYSWYNGASVRIKPFKSSSPQSNAATISCSAIL